MIDLNILYPFLMIFPILFIPLWKQCKLFKLFVYTNGNKIISMNLNNCNYYVLERGLHFWKVFFFFKLCFTLVLCLSPSVFVYTITISFAYLPYTYKEWTEVESSYSFIYLFISYISIIIITMWTAILCHHNVEVCCCK